MTPRTLKQTLLLAIAVLIASPVAAVAVPTLQGPIGASIPKARRVVSSQSGRIFIVDSRGKLHMLTKRGDLIATVLGGARAVTVGGGKVFVATAGAELVALDELTGKETSRVGLGVGEGPVGLTYDANRGLVWLAFASGMVQARQADGAIALQPTPAQTGALYRLIDIAFDAVADLIWVAQDQKMAGGMIVALNPETGARVKVLGAAGAGPVGLTGALAVKDGEIYVSDIFAGKVEVVGGNDAKVMTVGANEAGAGTLKQPTGLAFMANGDLLVVSAWTSAIERFGDGSALPECANDADCDGMTDDWEAQYGLAAQNAADSVGDADGDGLTNVEEFALGTNPQNADTDGDTVSDAEEIATGYDPLNGDDHDPVVVASTGGEYAPGKVSLSASVTNVMEGDTCVASWTQAGGATVALTDATGFAPSFVARKAGTYSFEVVATCGRWSSAKAGASATVLNLAPIPDAPRVSVVELGERQTLSARRSSDANGDALGFKWVQTSGPDLGALGTEASIAPRFSLPGAYGFKVTVADPAKAASAAEVKVVALGSRPVASAAVVSPLLGVIGQPVALDASASSRHDDAVFAWRQVSGATVEVSGASAPVAGFVPAEPGRYAFEVTIRQNNVSSPAALVEVFVGLPEQPLPVAVAAAPAAASVGQTISLDGSASTSATEYAWRQVSGPAAGLGSASAAVASAYLFAPGSYEFELTVKDGAMVGVPARLRVEVSKDGQALPVASVQAPATAHVGEYVTLDGSASTKARSFRWTQLAGPWVLLDGEEIEHFRPHKPGTYVFELEVDDGQVRSAPTRVAIVVSDDGMED